MFFHGSIFILLAPKNLAKPAIKTINARSVILTWQKPTVSGGLVIYYVLHAYHLFKNSSQSSRINDVAIWEGTISNLEAASSYNFTTEGFTVAGSVESEVTTGTTLPAGK